MGGFRIGRIAGIDIQIHWSWFAIFALLTWWLAEFLFQDWERSQAWLAAIFTVLLFFSSVLLHELSHSLVAKRLGLPVPNITLFIFGGVSALGEEPAKAQDEFKIAIVGPLTSFALGVIFGALALGLWQAGEDGSLLFTVTAYLGFINIAVGIFNMLPGFPLDGGRVLRSGLWARSGSMLKATKWASGVGQGIAFGLIALGVVMVLFAQLIGGIWFIVIGWFLRNASEASYQQLLFRSTLEGKKVGEMVNRAFQPAPPDVTLSQLVNEYILPYSQRCVPIIVSDDLLGLVSMSDLKRVPTEEWQTTSAFRAMTPREKLHVVAPDDDLTQALEIMASRDVHQLPVIDGREFLGFVTRADVLRLIQIRSEFSGVAEEEKTPA